MLQNHSHSRKGIFFSYMGLYTAIAAFFIAVIAVLFETLDILDYSKIIKFTALRNLIIVCSIVILTTTLLFFFLTNKWRLSGILGKRIFPVFLYVLGILVIVFSAVPNIPLYGWYSFFFGTIGILFSSAFISYNKASKGKKITKPNDWLYRRFFAKKIADYLADANSPLHRIAILGSWGEGKTQTLKLVQWELYNLLNSKEKFVDFDAKYIWINPWKASGKDEAFQVIADGFKEIRSPFGQIFESTGLNWVLAVISIFGFESVTDRVLEAIKSNFPDRAHRLLSDIDQELKERKVRLFVFVDDMERAEPVAIRAILPVIDRLSEMENCFFLFGIDRNRLEDAFSHLHRDVLIMDAATEKDNEDKSGSRKKAFSIPAKATVTGYLDKVMDLQLDLPFPAKHEIINFSKQWLKDYEDRCPKLMSAFESLSHHLPLNVRKCEKFLKSATQIELLFLQNYGERERNFEALFFVILGESCFPGFQRFLSETIPTWTRLADKSSLSLMGDIIKKSRKTDEFKEYRSHLIKKVEIGLDQNSEDLLDGVLEQIVDKFGFLQLLNLEQAEDPEWIVSGYSVQRVLPFNQREKLLDKWFSSKEKRRFSELLLDEEILALADRPSDEIRAISDTIIGNLQEARRRLELVYYGQLVPPEKPSDVKEVIDWLEKYAEYFSMGRNSLDELDCGILAIISKDTRGTAPSIVHSFQELIKAHPVDKNEENWLKKLRDTRIKAFQNIISCLDPTKISEVTTNYLKPGIHLLPEEFNEAGLEELHEAASPGREILAELFIQRFPNVKWDQVFEVTVHEKRQHPFVLLNPDHWVPFSGDNLDMSFMKKITADEENHEMLCDNLFYIIRSYFLRPFSEGDTDNLSFYVRPLFTEKHGRYIPYLKSFWELAMPLLSKEKQKILIDLRNKLMKRAKTEEKSVKTGEVENVSPLRVEVVEKAFPVD